MRPHLAIDLGTANCVIIKKGEGIVLNEPTVVAIEKKDKKVIAIGSEAKEMIGREPKGILARRPLKNGGISNFELAFEMLSRFIDISLGNIRLFKPDINIAVPSKINSIEKRALIKILERYGVNTINLIPESIAAAKGADLPIEKSVANLIINLGGGTAEIAMLSTNGLVSSESHVGTGDEINKAIIENLLKTYKVSIGENSAEKIKVRIADAFNKVGDSIVVSAKEIETAKSLDLQITNIDFYAGVRRVLNDIVEAIKRVLRSSGPELVSDLADRGIAMSGGTSQLRNLDAFLTKSLGVPCYIVDDPLNCVVRGLEKI